MAFVALHVPIDRSYISPTPEALGGLVDAFSSLYAPSLITNDSLSDAIAVREDWLITNSNKQFSLSIAEWRDNLTVENLSSDFKRRLELVSRDPKERNHTKAIEPFQLDRFCEFRAALAAERLVDVVGVKVSRANSSQDRAKHDLELIIDEQQTSVPIQVKATEGKKNRRDPLVPTLKNLWHLSFAALQEELRRLVQG